MDPIRGPAAVDEQAPQEARWGDEGVDRAEQPEAPV
jgi:hypothetical protein